MKESSELNSKLTSDQLIGGDSFCPCCRIRVLSRELQRAPHFRWDTHSFQCVWMARGGRAAMIFLPFSWAAGGGKLRRGGLRAAGFVIDSQRPDGRGISGRCPAAFAACASAANVREWLDQWVCDTQSDDRVCACLCVCQFLKDACYGEMLSLSCFVRVTLNSCF